MSLLFSGRTGNTKNRRVGFVQRVLMGVINHIRQALASLGELWRSPLATYCTCVLTGQSMGDPSFGINRSAPIGPFKGRPV